MKSAVRIWIYSDIYIYIIDIVCIYIYILYVYSIYVYSVYVYIYILVCI